MTEILTLGEVADLLGVQTWRVQRLFARGLLPEPSRVGIARVVARADVPKVKKALEEAGYLKK